MKGISSVTDSPRLGQAHRVVTLEAITAVNVGGLHAQGGPCDQYNIRKSPKE
jgi:hypothetical protein